MPRATSLFSTVVLILTSVGLSQTALANTKRFQESGGVVVMEVESVGTASGWKKEKSIGGFKGSGYYIWRGGNSFSKSTAGRGTIKYHFNIKRAGNYQLRWRSRIGQNNNSSEHNDSWVRFPSGKNIKGEHGLSGWTKVYMNRLGQWSWDAKTVDHVGKPIKQFFSAGNHTLEISGRSNGHAIDRIVLYQYDDVKFSDGAFTALPESRTSGNSNPEPEPQPEPKPAPQPEPQPKPQPAPVVSRAPVDVVEAAGIQLDDTPTPAVVSTALAAAPANLRFSVYSDTAAEIFWDRDSASRQYRVSINGNPVGTTDGISFFLDSLPTNQDLEITVTGVQDSTVTTEAARTTLNTGSRAQPASDLAAGPTGGNITVYSATAAELFWDRSTDISIVSTNVYRDGSLIGTTPGNSFFDDTRSDGVRYIYELQTVDVNGTKSNTSVVTEDGASNASAAAPAATPASAQGFLTLERSNGVLVGISRVVNLTDITNLLGNIPAFLVAANQRYNLFDENGAENQAELTASCLNGGSFSINPSADNPQVRNVVFSGCSDLGVSLSGELTYRAVDSGVGLDVRYNNLAITNDIGISVTVSGEHREALDPALNSYAVAYTDISYSLNDAFGEVFVTNMNQTLVTSLATPGVAELSTSFEVSGYWTFDQPLVISQIDAFVSEANSSHYRTGSLVAVDGANNTLELNADTGDVATYNAAVNENGNAVIQNAFWDGSVRLNNR